MVEIGQHRPIIPPFAGFAPFAKIFRRLGAISTDWLGKESSLVQLQTDPLCRAERPPEKPEGRILIVDDDYSLRRALHGTLLSAGFDVADVASGADALALMQVVRYDAVLLRLPSGIGICRELRRKFPRLAILILAAGETE